MGLAHHVDGIHRAYAVHVHGCLNDSGSYWENIQFHLDVGSNQCNALK